MSKTYKNDAHYMLTENTTSSIACPEHSEV